MDVLTILKKFLPADDVCIDTTIFRICTKAMFIILIAFSVLVTSKQYIGDPIDCIVSEKISQKVMDSFCWISSTHTLLNRLVGIVGKDIAQPGVASQSGYGDMIKYHRYYQWVCFALFFQALCSYCPRYIWKTYEGGRLAALSKDLMLPTIDEKTKIMRKKAVIHYFKENLKRQNFYAYRFFLCEFMNFLVAIGQIYFTNLLLDGEFLTYGIDVIQAGEVNPTARVFPKMTKCTFYKYGPSGSIEQYDGLCVLTVNVLNEKIYLILWFWFLSVCILSGIAIVFRILTCCIPALRLYMLHSKARFLSRREIDYILCRFEIGDWFLFYQLSKNIDPLIFEEICHNLATKLYGNLYLANSLWFITLFVCLLILSNILWRTDIKANYKQQFMVIAKLEYLRKFYVKLI